MFELMKMLRKDTYSTEERVNLSNLRSGCTVGFGFMPQRNISGCRMKVKTVNSYMFGEDEFLSHVLDNDDSDINLIVSTDKDSDEQILTLSQRIERRLFPMLFLTNEPDNWFSMKPGERLNTSHKVMGMQQSWVASSYRLAMLAEGAFMEGDYRLMKKPYNPEKLRPFKYALLIDDDNEHALEAEKYEDGTIIVYSTVYRPATDIGEITNPPSQGEYRSSVFVKEEENAEKPAAPAPAIEAKAKPAINPEERAADVFEITPKPNGVAHHLAEPEKNEKSEKKKPESGKKAAPATDLLTFDAKLAGSIINEAQDNNISLAEVIRKVIDMPASINDQVMIPFALSMAEYKELATRYGLTASDHEGIKAQIVKELQQFVGNKK